MDLYEGAIEAESPECPNCGHTTDDWPYHLDGERWPKITDEYKGYNGWNDTHDWNEIHKCVECRTKYWLETGI